MLIFCVCVCVPFLLIERIKFTNYVHLQSRYKEIDMHKIGYTILKHYKIHSYHNVIFYSVHATHIDKAGVDVVGAINAANRLQIYTVGLIYKAYKVIISSYLDTQVLDRGS